MRVDIDHRGHPLGLLLVYFFLEEADALEADEEEDVSGSEGTVPSS